MAKKTKKDNTSNNHSDSPEDIAPEVCQLKHIAIDKELENIKNDTERRHDEIKSMINTLQDNIKKDIKVSNTNLKDKIILTEKTIGDKIDSLSEFDDTLKGNGTPGVWENIRENKKAIGNTRTIGYWFVGVFTAIIIVLAIITIGGEWQGLSKEKKSLRLKTKEVEPKEALEPKEEVKLIKEVKLLAMPKD